MKFHRRSGLYNQEGSSSHTLTWINTLHLPDRAIDALECTAAREGATCLKLSRVRVTQMSVRLTTVR